LTEEISQVKRTQDASDIFIPMPPFTPPISMLTCVCATTGGRRKGINFASEHQRIINIELWGCRGPNVWRNWVVSVRADLDGNWWSESLAKFLPSPVWSSPLIHLIESSNRKLDASHRHIATCQGKGRYKPRCPDKGHIACVNVISRSCPPTGQTMSHRIGATSHRHIACVNVISRSCPPSGQTMSHRIVTSPPVRVRAATSPDAQIRRLRHRIAFMTVPAQFPLSSRTVPAQFPLQFPLENPCIIIRFARMTAQPRGGRQGRNVQIASFYSFEIHCLPLGAAPSFVRILLLYKDSLAGTVAGTVRELCGN
jgi:hypothetical protein